MGNCCVDENSIECDWRGEFVWIRNVCMDGESIGYTPTQSERDFHADFNWSLLKRLATGSEEIKLFPLIWWARKLFLVFMEITVVCRDDDAGVFSVVDKRSRVVKFRWKLFFKCWACVRRHHHSIHWIVIWMFCCSLFGCLFYRKTSDYW